MIAVPKHRFQARTGLFPIRNPFGGLSFWWRIAFTASCLRNYRARVRHEHRASGRGLESESVPINGSLYLNLGRVTDRTIKDHHRSSSLRGSLHNRSHQSHAPSANVLINCGGSVGSKICSARAV